MGSKNWFTTHTSRPLIPNCTIHNHYWSGSCALVDDICDTQKIHVVGSWLVFWPFASPMATLEWSNSNHQHHSFKIAATFALTSHKTSSMIKTSHLNTSFEAELNTLEKLSNSRTCYMYRHGYRNRKGNY